MTERRPFDLLVLGATGFTGRQVVSHVAARAPALGLRWAIAGRDADRLRALSSDLPVQVEAETGMEVDVEVELEVEPAVVTVDVTDRSALAAAVSSATMVANTVGPYAQHGAAVQAACVESGTDQIDLCGELVWLRDSIRQLEQRAVTTGARIVSTAGFESLPFDLLTLAAAEAARDRWDQALADIDVAITVTQDPPVGRLADLLSAGTLRSGAEAIRSGSHTGADDARLLDPEPHRPLPFDLTPRRHEGTGQWLAPLIPSPYINPITVHRTAALARSETATLFDPDFRFREGMTAAGLVPGLPDAMAAQWFSSAVLGGSLLAAAPPMIRSMVADAVQSYGPPAGQGPDEARLSGWSWKLQGLACTTGGHRLTVTAEGVGHPGYRSTAALFAEAAMLLSLERPSGPGGFLTPAIALGTGSLPRLAAAGLQVSVDGA